MKKIFLTFGLILMGILFLFFFGCASSSTTTQESTSVVTHTVNVPTPVIHNDQTIDYDTVTTTWHANTVTPAGDTVHTTITEVTNPRKPKSKPNLHVVQTITAPPVAYVDTMTVNKTKSTQIVKTPNPILTAIASFVSFVLKFLWWLIFSAAVIIGIIYAIRKKLINTLLK